MGGRDLLGEAVVAVHEVQARGDGALAQLLALVLIARAVAAALRADAAS